MDMCGLGSDPTPKKVLIVDDHSIVRRGLTEFLGQQPDLCICAAAASAEEALEIAEGQPIDLAIVDISMGQMDGITLTRELKQRYPEILVLILSMHDESLYGARARRAGAAGFVAKQDGSDALLEAISRILRDQDHHPTNE
jgi:DNA-binding NarL/FixJ family response regulator